MKLKTWIYRLLLFSPFLLVGYLHAEGECPPGMFPTNPPGTQGPVGCAPIPGYDNAPQQSPTQQSISPRWVNRWGAIASDGLAGVIGSASNLSDQKEAEQTAMANCQSEGGTHCKIDASYANECAAVVVGSMGYSVAPGANVDEAVQIGMKECGKDGALGCHVYHSTCSPPVRVQ